jgi:glycolate dehydrogenase FAD-binding subunit
VTPATADDAAAILADAAARGATVRPVGGGTRSAWGAPVSGDVALSTAGLDAIVAHNAADLTAVLGAGVPVAAAQAAFAEAGQMLAVDAPSLAGATIGGLVATGDSGPLRHAFRAVRDLVLGVRVALVDGTVARAGSNVIKNVAGYDLAKLMSGSFGTLGVICEVSVRLHPKPTLTATAVGRADDPEAIAAAAVALAHEPLEAISLDVRWEDGAGLVAVRMAGRTAAVRAGTVAAALAARGLEAGIEEEDEPLWAAQRSAQRAPQRAPQRAESRVGRSEPDEVDTGAVVVRVSTTNRGLAEVLGAARDLDARAVGRGGLGLVWLTLPAGDDAVGRVQALRTRLAPAPVVVLDAPLELRSAIDPWGDAGPVELMRRVKQRFDPQNTLNPGIYVGGI